MSFRKFGGLQYSAKYNSVSSNYNTSNNLQAKTIGQPNTYINMKSDLSGNSSINSVPNNAQIQATIQEAVQAALKIWMPNSTFTLLDGTPLTFDITGSLVQKSYSSYIPTLSNIRSISLGNNVIGILNNAFESLTSLESINFPKSVISIGDSIFLNVPTLMSITVDYDNINYSSDSDRVLFNKNKTTLIAYPAGSTQSSYTIPNTVKTIASFAFNTVSKMTSLTIPSSVTTLGQGIVANTAIQKIIFTTGSQLTSIPAGAFADATSLNFIYIPPSVQSIGDSAFQDAISLPSIVIPSYVTSIGAGAFQGAIFLDSVIFALNPQNINIDNTAFADCPQIINVTFESSDNLKNMGFRASNSKQDFFGAQAIISGPMLEPGQATTFTLLDQEIKNVDIQGVLTKEVFTSLSSKYYIPITSINEISVGSHVTSIGSSVFQTTPPTTLSNFTITIPNTVTFIDLRAFQDATSLTSITVDTSNTNYSSDIHGILFNTNKTTLIQYPIGNIRTSYTTIPASVTSIGAYAFENAINLTSITIPKTVNNIDNTAFTGCSQLTMINFESSTNLDILNATVSANEQYFYGTPNKVTISVETMITLKDTTTKYIDISAITEISSYSDISIGDIASVSVGSRVTAIGPSSFKTTPPNMSSLTSINIPYLVTSIDELAFDSTFKLTTITENSDNNNNYSSLDGVLFNNEQTILLAYPAGGRASYFIPTTVTAIGAYAFAQASNLTSLTIPNIVTSLGQYIVSNASNLTTIDLGSCSSQLTSIGDYVFANATALTSITIPNSVVSIGDSAFKNTTNLQSITIPNSVINIENTAFTDSGLTAVFFYSTINLTNPIIYITDNPQFFCGTTNKVNISIKLTQFTLKNETTTPTITTIDISGTLLQSSYNNRAIYTPKNAIKSVLVGSLVKTIEANAFSNTSLESVIIPRSVTNIDPSAFNSTPNLETIEVESGNDTYSSDIYGVLFDKMTNTLIQYPTGNTQTSYTIPNTVTNIEPNAFQNAIYLTSITVESGNSSFSSVDGVLFNTITNTLIQYPIGNTQTSYTLPNTVTKIGANAFQSAINLTSIIIPQSVTYIDNTAFTSSLVKTVIFDSSAYITSNNIDVTNNPQSFCGATGVNVSVGTIFTLNTVTTPQTITKQIRDIRGTLNQPYLEITLTDVQSVSVGTNVTSIAANAFNGATSLQSITIPASVTSISDQAFALGLDAVSSLTSINVDPGNSIYSSIDGTLFNKTITTLIQYPNGNPNTLYTIPNTVTGIGVYAFQGKSNLMSIIIPASVTSIDPLAFDASDITNIVFESSTYLTSNNIDVINNPQFFCGTANKVIVSVGTTFTFNNETTPQTFVDIQGPLIIPNGINKNNISSVSVGTNVTSIGLTGSLGTFENASALTTVTFASGSQVTSIGVHAFYYATKLQSITLPNSVTSIGDAAFYHTTSLQSIMIPASVTTIGNQAFTLGPDTVSSFTSINVHPGNSTYSSDGVALFNKSTNTLIQYPNGNLNASYTIPYALPNGLPNGLVTKIGAYAFQGKSNLLSITIPASVTYIDESAFSASDITTVVFETSAYLTNNNITIDNTPQYFFGATNVTVSVGTIFTLNNGTTQISNTPGVFVMPSSINISAIKSLSIGTAVTSIGENAFANTTSLTSITIPASVTTIGNDAFISSALTSASFVTKTNLISLGDSNGFTIGTLQPFFGAINVTISALDFSLNTTPFKQYYYSSYFIPLTVSRDTTGYTRCDVLLVGSGGDAGNNGAYAGDNTAGIFFGGAGGGGGSASFTNIMCNPISGKIEFNFEQKDSFGYTTRQLNSWKLKGKSLSCNLNVGNGRDGANITGSASTYSSNGGSAWGSVGGLPSGTVLTTHNGGNGTPNKFCDFPYLGDAIYGGNYGTYPFPLPGNADPLPVGGAPGAILPQFTPPSPQNGHGQSYQSISTPFSQIITYDPFVVGSTTYNLYATNPGVAYVEVILYNP